MNDISFLLGQLLLRTSLCLALAAAAALVVLRLARPSRPLVHRQAWLLVLLAGWTILRVPVAVPWYEASAARRAPSGPMAASPMPAPPPLDTVSQGDWPLVVDTPAVPAAAELLPATAPPDVLITSAPATPVVPAAKRVRPAAPAVNWQILRSRAAIGGWLLGMALLALVWLAGYARFVRSLRRRVPAEQSWQTEWRQVLSEAGVRRAIPLSMCGELGPVLCRLPRGYELIVPAGLWRELDAAQRRAILRHELAHYRRGDVWKSLAARLLALPHWFNPLSWLAVRRFEEAAEWACDRVATGEGPDTEYAKVLLRLAQTPSALGYGSAARGRSLAARVRRVLAGEPKEDSTMKRALLIAAGLGLIVVSVVEVNLVARQPATAEGKSDDFAITATEPTEEKGASVFDPKPPASSLQPVEQPATSKKSPALDNMVTQAKLAYYGYFQDYLAQNAPMSAVYEWSLRWMMAAENAAANKQERIAAVKAHVKRMELLREGIQKMYQMGVRGGEFSKLAAANFYLAEAERRLEQAQTPATPTTSSSSPTEAQQRVAAEAQAMDVKIKFAELRGELEQAQAQLEATDRVRRRLQQIPGINTDVAVRSELEKLQAEQNQLRAKIESLEEQLKLYGDKLKLAASSAGQANPFENKEAAAPPPKTERAGGAPIPPNTFQGELLYDGRAFDAWAADLMSDLSPQRRTEAIRAMAAFGANGQGPRAAAAILEVMKGYSVWGRDNSPEGQLKDAALAAFGYAGSFLTSSIPKEDSLPLLQEALKSPNANQRLFAVTVLPALALDKEEAVGRLGGMVNDPSDEVRRSVVPWLLAQAPQTPGLVEVVREALHSADPNTLQWAMYTINQTTAPALTALVPDLVAIMDREPFPIGGMGGGMRLPTAQSALTQMGTAAVPALEQAAKSDNPKIRERAEAALKAIRAKPADDAKPKPLTEIK